MNSLGNKKFKLQSMGNKQYLSGKTLGSKLYDKSSKVPNLEQKSDPNITNYANHPNNLYEPIKGINMPKIKKSYLIEKPKTDKKHNQHYE